MHPVNLYEAKTGIVLKEQMLAETEGEGTHMKQFLTALVLKERLISADALSTQKSCCQETIASEGDFLLFAKGNQPTLGENVRLFFGEPPRDCRDRRSDEEACNGHGRLTTRLIQVSTELNSSLECDGWYGIGQVFCLRRRVETNAHGRKKTSLASRVSLPN